MDTNVIKITQREFNSRMNKNCRHPGTAVFEYINFEGIDFTPHSSYKHVVFSHCVFDNMVLRHINFSCACFDNCSFICCIITDSDFTKDRFQNTSFKGTVFDTVPFCNSWGAYNDFTKAVLREVDFFGANLVNTNFLQANMDFSCLPLWCGSLSMQFDDAVLSQIAYHLLKAGLNSPNASPEAKKVLRRLKVFANKFHRARELGKIKANEGADVKYIYEEDKPNE